MLFAIPDQLIFLLVVVVISMLHSWWKKRKGQPETETQSESWPGQKPNRPPPPAGRPAPPPSKAASWEEELRRLLQGEEPPRPAPPPVVVQLPPPLPRTASRPAPRPVIVEQSDPDMEKGLPVKMPSLEQSAQAFLRASQLESKVAAHMQRVDQQVTAHPKLDLKKEVSPAIRQAVTLVRDRQSQRAAILAGIILGPPKAMEG
ncbi:MAG: hypothetical protein ACKVYV_05085 [Limisphaerales bacterium]